LQKEESDNQRPLRVTVVTKSGSLAGGANTYEAAVIRLLSGLDAEGRIELSVLVPGEVPGAEGDVDHLGSHRYPNSKVSKARSVLASTLLGRLLSTMVPVSPLQRSLKKMRPDLVYFASPNIHAMGIHGHRYVFTVDRKSVV